MEDLYSRKRRQAQIVTRKMEEKDLAEMESKLEQTAMGKLIDKDQFKVLTSKEEKVRFFHCLCEACIFWW